MRELFIQATYLAAAVLFILGLRGLSSPASARRGMNYAAIGMFFAVVGTLLNAEIITYTWIIVAMVIGSLIGAAISIWMPMTAVPQRTAISHMFGALAATLVGVSEYYRHFHGIGAPGMDRVHMAALGFEVWFGSLTITGSFMAFGKLQGFVRSEPMTYKFQNVSNIALFFLTAAMFVYLIVDPTAYVVFYLMIAIGLLIGVLLVMPIGGADMPVVISLLNSYAGLASAATGFVLGNNVLIIAGSLDGSSGFLLSILMCKAMNRSFRNVLFGAFGSADTAAASLKSAQEKTVRSLTVEDAAVQLGYARSVIFVPGYGMAVAQAQHAVKELTDEIEKRGGVVKFAVHPVAGRMPGHMNVLLAEANVPYDELYDLDNINDDFARTDAVIIVGANDVVNPAARHDTSSPIYGMPIIDADKAKNVIVMKRSMNPGFAGIENELFYYPKTFMLFGDAKKMLEQLVAEVRRLD